ncbi:MAG TPA: hypothetical protein P5279_07000 [Anaerohalosphaeraceae bacterium]|jgi:hypothetical protein|nr:hypothetical protein [Anaerohalosphaeraceae bacterium]HRT50222.1 hypothetical protein [Anaerohalosphaeraceae bacterium]HRT86153.1 hypothetical protein [Anaerohalosphaeraceae bacterium]
MAGESKTTTDHEQIRQWVEERGGSPAVVAETHGEDETGILRIDMPGYSGGESLEHISWEEWFEKFDAEDLAFLYQDTTQEGEQSSFNKIISKAHAR